MEDRFAESLDDDASKSRREIKISWSDVGNNFQRFATLSEFTWSRAILNAILTLVWPLLYPQISINSSPSQSQHHPNITTTMSSKRQSTAPPLPKPPASISSSVTIADNASVTGTHPITIGSNTVVHPRTKLATAHGPITIGKNCIISERSNIGLQSAGGEDVVIGNGVVVEVGAVVEGRDIGEGCIIEVGAKIGKGAVLGKVWLLSLSSSFVLRIFVLMVNSQHCKIGPLCEVQEGETIPDFTVIYGNGLRRLDTSGIEDAKMRMVGRQVEVLKKLIPSNVAKFQ